jgi:RNA polymerase I-specific transcription initiation factor RRN3
VTYVDNLLRLENSSIGEVVGSVILMMVMERMLDLDLVSGCDDSNGGMFDMELEDAVESTMNEGDEVGLV